IDAGKLGYNTIAQTILARPLPPYSSIHPDKVALDSEENRTDYYYLIGWDGDQNSPPEPVTILLHSWHPSEPPRLHAEAFLQSYRRSVERFAASPVDEPQSFFVLASCVPRCFDSNIPNANEKATLKIVSFPRDNSETAVFFSRNTELYETIKSYQNGAIMSRPMALTVTLQWSDPSEGNRYPELIKIDSFDWHP
ncbi:MAG: hypothetical protein AAGC74_10640, partial [Verrucomicrobiota bacterium]